MLILLRKAGEGYHPKNGGGGGRWHDLVIRAPARTFVRTCFRRQHPVGSYILDFYARAAKLAYEIDGAAHDVQSRAVRDLARDAWLADQGIRVLRFIAADVLNEKRRDDVLSTIAAAILPDE